MVYLLQVLSTIGIVLSIGVIASLLVAIVSNFNRWLLRETRHSRVRAEELRAETEQLRSEAHEEIVGASASSGHSREEGERETQEQGQPESAHEIRQLMRAELKADRRESFWPNLWLNIGTNFVTNLFFFVLGVVVTLLTAQHR